MCLLNSRFLDILLWLVMIAGLLGPITIMIKDWRNGKMKEFKVDGLLYAAVIAEGGTGIPIIMNDVCSFSPESALQRALRSRLRFSEVYLKAYPIIGIAKIDMTCRIVKEVKNDEIV